MWDDGSMPRLTKIYTRTGDEGLTGLGGGQRVPKDSRRVDDLRHGRRAQLADRGRAGDRAVRAPRHGAAAHPERAVRPRVRPGDARRKPGASPGPDRRDPPHREARTADRRAQRGGRSARPTSCCRVDRSGRPSCTSRGRSVDGRSARRPALARDEAIGPTVLPYLNRLSDALFVMARYENHEAGVVEPLWRPGT